MVSNAKLRKFCIPPICVLVCDVTHKLRKICVWTVELWLTDHECWLTYLYARISLYYDSTYLTVLPFIYLPCFNLICMSALHKEKNKK